MKILTLIHGDIRPPLLPTPLTETFIQHCTEKTNGNLFLGLVFMFQTAFKLFFQDKRAAIIAQRQLEIRMQDLAFYLYSFVGFRIKAFF